MEMNLVLEDGAVFRGVSFGAKDEVCGWVHSDHRMAGYQEVLTDPDNGGCLVNMTYPLVGNYGTNEEDFENDAIYAGALIIKAKSRIVSNWRATGSLDEMMRKKNIVGLEDVDTRSLALHIRKHGEMRGVIGSADKPVPALLKKLKAWKEPLFTVADVARSSSGSASSRVVLYNLGARRSTLSQLEQLGCEIMCVSGSCSWEEIKSLRPDGLVISNGPGHPEQMEKIREEIKKAMDQLPVLGICLGAQLLCLAAGGTVARMKTGHHGGNYAVRSVDDNQVSMTTQNHSFVMGNTENLPRNMSISHMNVNDGSIEGISSADYAITGIQFIPLPDEEGNPHAIFRRFTQTMKSK
ncbi:MAG: glutamine-hydrolyzing carbamoyl-phosphate synthase small subunit [Syntrophobacterales bacterium]|nr:glutamine-hydrolyzing carbamoyl-phosphate synthase small subunit [Syntrophobacterales bacterium]